MNKQQLVWSCSPKKDGFCPSCFQRGKKVPHSAVLHFIKDEFLTLFSHLKTYHFCANASCNIVYFNVNQTLVQENLKYDIALKNNTDSSTVCYCFEHSKESMRKEYKKTGEVFTLEQIKENMENRLCKCEVNNPKGKCCMSDVKKAIDEIKKEELYLER